MKELSRCDAEGSVPAAGEEGGGGGGGKPLASNLMDDL